jgi:hypothetical protein
VRKSARRDGARLPGKRFAKHKDAEQYLAKVTTDRATGAYTRQARAMSTELVEAIIEEPSYAAR